jgi:hypothetical protein
MITRRSTFLEVSTSEADRDNVPVSLLDIAVVAGMGLMTVVGLEGSAAPSLAFCCDLLDDQCRLQQCI